MGRSLPVGAVLICCVSWDRGERKVRRNNKSRTFECMMQLQTHPIRLGCFATSGSPESIVLTGALTGSEFEKVPIADYNIDPVSPLFDFDTQYGG